MKPVQIVITRRHKERWRVATMSLTETVGAAMSDVEGVKSLLEHLLPEMEIIDEIPSDRGSAFIGPPKG